MPDPDVVTGPATEPLLTRGAIVAVATALLGVAAAWGLPLNPDQKAETIGLISALAPLVLAWWARRHVNSPASTAKALGRPPA